MNHVAHSSFTGKLPLATKPMHISKLNSTLHQLVRDWAAEGFEGRLRCAIHPCCPKTKSSERQACYLPLLEALERYVPLEGTQVRFCDCI